MNNLDKYILDTTIEEHNDLILLIDELENIVKHDIRFSEKEVYVNKNFNGEKLIELNDFINLIKGIHNEINSITLEEIKKEILRLRRIRK